MRDRQHQGGQTAGGRGLPDRGRRRGFRRRPRGVRRSPPEEVEEVERLQWRRERHHDLYDEPQRDELTETSGHRQPLRIQDECPRGRRFLLLVRSGGDTYRWATAGALRQNRTQISESYISVHAGVANTAAPRSLEGYIRHFCRREIYGRHECRQRTVFQPKQKFRKTRTSPSKTRDSRGRAALSVSGTQLVFEARERL